MIRRIARELVLQSLFQIDFAQADSTAALDAAIEERADKSAEKARAYALDVLNGVLTNNEAIDTKISEYAIDWTLERMPAVDRNILRVAVYEMFFAPEKLVPNVAINEAVEIAKIYGTDDTPRFINGVLGKMVRSDV
ncbi:transcription antitermination factor NusB [Phascolarctobacterium sp.]